MPLNQDPPDPALVQRWFLENPAVMPGTFELGLVLGGTVSAGAYTAGALDFLIEALDCWEAARGDPEVPQHRVLLRVVSGTSGGGVNAAIAARALNYEFPHIARGRPIAAAGSGNPFYDCWIRDLTLDRFLATGSDDAELISILNGRTIDDGAAKIVTFTGPPKSRPWLGTPLRTILTLTNLAGVPYRLDLTTGSETFVNHADYMRFAINYSDRPIPAKADFRPDELVLDFGQSAPGLSDAIGWDRFAEFAKGTAAFPVGFPPRELTRPADHYRWRIVARPDAPADKPPYWAMTPDWDAMLLSGAATAAGEYFFLAVDGGTTDNEPIELARTALCGILDRNPQSAAAADRAVVLVDPFGGKEDLGRQTAGSFADNLGNLLGAIIQQTRYDSRDVALAADPDVYSRFILAPRQDPASKRPAITSGGLSAFIGFASVDFMRYDYLLGRQNCQDFLRKEFVLAETNAKVFGAPWTLQQKEKFAAVAPAGFLPIVPLTGTAAQPQQRDDWPAGKLDPERYRGAIEARFRAILGAATSSSGFALRTTSWLGGFVGDGYLADKVIAAINAYLINAELK